MGAAKHKYHGDHSEGECAKRGKTHAPIDMEKVDEHEYRENQVRSEFGNDVRERRFHAVNAFYQNVFERTRRHVKNGTQWHSRKLIAKILADVSEDIECRYVRKRRGNAVKQDVSEPECRNNQTFF